MTILFQQQWDEWHTAHEKRRADPHGFLAITSLNWLNATPQRFDDAPGSWSTGPSGVVVSLADGEELVVDGVAVTGTHQFAPLAERADIAVGWGDVVIEIARRGGFDVIRPRNPASKVLAGYAGTSAYPADEKWVVPGNFTPYESPRPTPVGSVAEGIEHVYESPGTVSFSIGGDELSLIAFNGAAPGSLFVLFTDATSGLTTYAANRSLFIAPPGPDGSVTLDFNRATNLPCAYTEFATCPLPPAGNKLAVAIEAGELKPQ
ncbi:DUF1684 domain-containing protein [Actinoplanes sp. CA-015351]|uniref:DUF1684 domain-containing protein n=1 Tax=Actinoplanes sp. CA-015351 TaxID=3239897 RepID=UPI003D96A646